MRGWKRTGGRLPSFVVIGAAKCGTASLHHYLDAHPQIFMCPRREPNFFAAPWIRDDRRHVASLDDYRSLFRGARDAVAVGEVSPVYMRFAQVARNIHRHVEQARIVAILREPAARAYSDYRMLRRKGRESRTPEAALDESSHYLAGSRYHAQLEPYFEAFASGRIQVLLLEDLKRQPHETMRALLDFLGVDASVELPVASRFNAGDRKGLGRWLGIARPEPPMSDEVRARVRAWLRSDVDRLRTLLDRDLHEWEH